MDLALRAVGRTLVNFQRLEHNLKLVARLGPLKGTLAKMERDVAKRVERAAELTLGGAIQAWLSTAGGEMTLSGSTPDLFDADFQLAISFVPDAENLAAHGVALKSLLDIRNKLVHSDLLHIQWESPEECNRLVTKLDAVNAEIGPQMQFFESILSAFAVLGRIPKEEWQKVFSFDQPATPA